MTVLRQVIESASDATLKGRAINAFGKATQGRPDVALLDLTGSIVDLETFSLGDNVFELQDISTAETATGSAAAATTPNITLNVAPDRDFIVGEVFIIGTEFCKVTNYVAGSLLVGVERGYAGSTAAIQSAATILRSSAAAVANGGSGNIIVPTVDLTQADAAAKVILAVPALRSEYGARAVGTNDVEFDVAFSDAQPANSEALANGTLANFAGGEDSATVETSEFVHVVDSTGPDQVVVLPFTARFIDYKLYTSAGVKINETVDVAGASVQNEPTAVISAKELTFTESAQQSFAVGQFLLIKAYK